MLEVGVDNNSAAGVELGSDLFVQQMRRNHGAQVVQQAVHVHPAQCRARRTRIDRGELLHFIDQFAQMPTGFQDLLERGGLIGA
jgi:hypothetical protein